MVKFILSALTAASLTVAASTAFASGGDTKLVEQDWTWQGVFGHYDKAQLQRGFQVYKDVCSTCHGLRLVSYRHLTDIGFSEDEVKDIAAQYEIQDGPNDEGEMFMRPRTPADRFNAPFPNDKAARFANGGALPPDLSLINKARANGPDYVYTLLTAYEEPPEDVVMADGMSYNPAFPGHQIAMPQMIFDDSVTYEDGAPSDAASIARDVTAFLQWAAEPELEVRKSLGIKVMLFLFVLTVVLYAYKRQVWSKVDH